MSYRTIEWAEDRVVMLDQRRLPGEVVYITLQDYRQVIDAIREMAIRGAPAIGAAGAYAMALAARQESAADAGELLEMLQKAAVKINAARPTAVNLAWAVERVLSRLESARPESIYQIQRITLAEAQAVAAEDVRTNRLIGQNAQPLVPQEAVFIHHCNTGTLATVDYGTALGIIRASHEAGKKVFVYVDETRPRLQGARLTAWELQQLGIPHAVIADGASGYVMRTRQVDLVTVGCDRVAANGDTANKIGTYNLALAAKAHGVPFYVAAPTSTIDLSLENGEQITIEEREAGEIHFIGRERITPEGTQVFNPAFDVTPADLITAIITEAGIAFPPYRESLAGMVARARELHAQSQENAGG